MSFNIRYGTAKDGENHWTERREMLLDVIREQDADIVGLQEALASQIDEIVAAVPIYAVVGVGRDDAARAGEFSAILFRKDRLRVAEAGTFWFSDTPSVPGSKSWGNNITRISTWARFVDRDGRGFYHFNLHLDHESQPSRERSTVLLKQRIDGARGGEGAGRRHRGLQRWRTQSGARGARRHRAGRRDGGVRGHVPRPSPRRHDRRHVHGLQVRRDRRRED